MRLTDRARKRAAAAAGAVLLLLAVVLGVGPASVASGAVTTVAGATLGPAPVAVSGIDLHDGQIQRFGSTFYLYGTMYGCGYTWQQNPTPWCGFGVSTAPSMAGPWSTPTLLFPANAADPYNPGHTYQTVCGTGSGCFSPRMIQRTGWGANDNVFVLWFNGPAWMDPVNGGAPHGYMVMGCNGPTGPCGATAGAPYGSTYRPILHQCSGANGDPGLSASIQNNALSLVCPKGGHDLGQEQLDRWGTNGTNVGTASIPGLTGNIEATGTYQDSSTGVWVMTFSDPGCGYCAGTQTGYATASNQLGPWTAPANRGVGAPANGRRAISTSSCGGQPDTVSVIDGQAWQKVDLWTGAMNETNAGLLLVPLVYNPAVSYGSTGDGHIWHAPFYDWSCN